ncbi:carnosine N-methyltransferase 2-like [Anolis sagrei]|uniref:carnosine N-methyltransferase 2-like n=1 Tax=Anolis sagrei TaxID=38937 RepID=UPI00295BA717|nr:carnosine N-methyltransferase 2-like [Anolis sagrei ordinatus]XP_060632083.1 carnosine N-methyltransferase 2-like [Anolis sagrei ordinatus]XP_060632090.1 carnosine N-methyltransferase 2-like [Anolis sagrei ordinatus]XP_060632097.1 carnosine N-methyltransferase 2-like [Anolis sagrei ordinatus]
MEPKAKVKRVFKPKQSKIADGCRRVGVFPKGICPINGSRLPLVRAINEDDEHESRKVKDATFDQEILLTPSKNTELSAFQPMRSLTVEEYAKAFKSFLEHSTEHQCMEQFNKEELPSIIASLGNGKSTINVLGVGSGTGEQDLKMIKIIQAKHPGVFIKNEIIEPNPQHILAYKDAVMGSDLKNVSFTWHQMTSMEYEKQAKEKSMQKKYDFIHLIQMLYRVENIASTIKYFHSCLDKHAKLLIIILSGNSGWTTMWKKYRQCFPPTDSGHYITGDDVKVILEEMGLEYQMYEFPSDWDITECFTDGDIIGGHTLDFLTGTKDFMNTAPDDLKQSLRQALSQPECSTKKNGRIMFRNDLSMIVVNS